MSPDARAICTALLYVHGWPAAGIPTSVGDIEALLPKEPGIRGMVPVAYLKDVIEGFIYRLEAMPILGDAREAMEYAKRRRADVENL